MLGLFASVLVPVGGSVTDAHDQTSWYVNDNPQLNGPSKYWYAGASGKGYGSNNYVYTYDIAGKSSADNWVRWSMERRVGRYKNTAISAGYRHSCGIRAGGSVVCWGSNTYGQTDAPSGNFTAISAGYRHSCGIRAGGSVVCWGSNTYGQTDAPSGNFTAISAGSYHSCGIRAGGSVVCWGRNTYDQTDAPSGNFTAISAGSSHSCGIRADDSVVCWGDNENDGGGGQADAPSGNFTAISAGSSQSCGIRAGGSVVCWGHNTYDQTDAPSGNFTAISAGWNFSCGIRADDSVVCWDEFTYDEADAPSGNFAAISVAPNNHACGIRAGGSVVCWGHNRYGQTDAPSGNFAGVRTDAAPQVQPPGVPNILGAVVEVNSIGVAWSPPSSNGGSPITGYRVDLYRNSQRVERKSVSASAREVTFRGLAADTAYQLRVSARNSAGYGNRDTANTRTTAAPQPQVVRSVAISLGADRSNCGYSYLPCRWVSASYSGFSAGTYRVQCYFSSSRSSLGTRTASYNTSRISGTNAELCWFNVQPGRYLTAIVDGVRSNTIVFAGDTQATVPSAPRNIQTSSTSTNNVNISWSPPSDDGGATVSGYRVELHQNNSRISTKNLSGSARSTSFSGLNADTAYEVRVSAENSVGRGSTARENFRTTQQQQQDTQNQQENEDQETQNEVSVPSAPLSLQADADENSVTVSWSAPSDDGNSPITGYQVELYRGGNHVETKSLWSAARSVTFSSLKPGTDYAAYVSAENSKGLGSPDLLDFQTEAAQPQPPSPPTNLTATAKNANNQKDRAIQASWSAPTNNGNSPISHYIFQWSRTGKTWDEKITRSTSAELTNARSDTKYTITVTAVNKAGQKSQPATATATATSQVISSVRPTIRRTASAKSAMDQKSVKKDADSLERYGVWQQGEGGGSGSNGFWYTYNASDYGRWRFGDLRGIYRAEHFYVKQGGAVRKGSCNWNNATCIDANPTASMQYRIYQCDESYENCHRVRTLNSSLYDGDDKAKEGWRRWNSIELNGYVIVEAHKRYDNNETRLAIDSFKFEWQDLLPEDRKIAIAACQAHALEEVIQTKNIKAWSNFLGNLGVTLFLVSASYFTGKAVSAALAKVPALVNAVTTLVSAKAAVTAFQAALKIIALVENILNLKDAFENIKTGLEVLQNVVKLMDELVEKDILGEQENVDLYETYKDWCNNAKGTLTDYSTGRYDFGGGTKNIGKGCPSYLRSLCVPGYLEYAPDWKI